MKVVILLDDGSHVFEDVEKFGNRYTYNGLQYILHMPYGTIHIHDKDIVSFQVFNQ